MIIYVIKKNREKIVIELLLLNYIFEEENFKAMMCLFIMFIFFIN